MTIIAIILFCFVVALPILLFMLFQLLQYAQSDNLKLSIKANAPRVVSSPDDVICYVRLADGTSYEVKRKDIAIGGKSNA